MSTDETQGADAMSEQSPAPATGAPEQPPAPAGDQLGEGGTKALEAERTARKAAEAKIKELQPLADRLAEIENANKDELTKATDSLAATQAERDEARAEVARLNAAVKHGLTADDLDLLGSGTPEQIEARAEKLAARLGDPSAPRRPSPDPTQGSDGGVPPGSAAEAFGAALGLM